MSDKETEREGIHISQNQLTALSIIAGAMIIFFAWQHNQAPAAPIEPQSAPAAQAEQVAANNPIVAASSTSNTATPVADLPTIAREWSPRVVRIVCWDSSYISSGTGVLSRVNLSSIGLPDSPTLITNKHVVTDSDTGYLYTTCGFQTPDSAQVLTIDMSTERQSDTYDVSYFPLPAANPPSGAMSGIKVCGPNQAVVGDKLAILGYPADGGTGTASKAITLTQGVVSSFDGDYYVTDAKIDHGNSGGAAILIKDDCYLGIPTWVQSGGFESFGRILSAQNVLTAN